MTFRPKLVALAVLSGLSGLGSETIFFKLLDDSVGAAPLVAFTVVATFILGVGASSILSSKIVRPWIAEALLAAYNLGWLIFFSAILALNGAILGRLAPHVGPNTASSWVALVYLAPPALLLGVSFPAVIERQADLAAPYLLQSAGAVLGILLVEGILFPRLGLPGCLVFLIAAHLASALLLFGGDFVFPRRAFGRLAPILIVAGAATGAFQGIWLFLAQLLFQPFYFVQPIVVLSMLAGIAIGSLLWIRARIRFSRALYAVLGGTAISTGLVLVWLRLPQTTSFVAGVAQIPILLLPAAIPIGLLLPAYFSDRDPNRSEAGAAFFSIALGNALGIIGAGGILLALVGPIWAMLAAALLIAGALAFIERLASWPALVPLSVVALAAAFATDDAFIARMPEHQGQKIEIEREFRGPAELTAIYAFVSPRTHQRQRRLFQSGFSPIYLDGSPEGLIGAVGASYATKNARALVLGAGSGKSASAMARVFLHTDVVDIGATVPALLEALADENDHFLSRPTVAYHPIDGILAPWVLLGPYDLIVLTVDPGYHAKAAKLYALDYFQSLKRILDPNGVLVLWSDSALGEEANQVLINTAKAAFRNQKLFAAGARAPETEQQLTYYFLVQSDGPLDYDPARLVLGLVLDDDAAVRALPGFRNGGDKARERERLIEGRAHPTEEVHTFAHPAPSILFGGYHAGSVVIE